MQFKEVIVLKTKENFHYIEWDMLPAEHEAIDDYNFQIHWSEDPASGFLPILDQFGDPVVIDGAVGPLSYTHQRRDYDFNLDTYYKVLAIEKAHPAHTFFSNVTSTGQAFNGFHDSIRHAEEVIYGMYIGEPCLIIKKKSFGARCPECWSPQRQQRMKTHCDTCKGSGYVTGYYQPISMQIAFDSNPRKTDLQKEFENVQASQRARISNYPLVRPKDLIVNTDTNQRWVISHVETTKLPTLAKSSSTFSKQNYVISQLLTLEELNPNDNEYFIDTDNIPEIPLAEEGRTGSTLPFFNDHMPATTTAPLHISDLKQNVELLYNSAQFSIAPAGFLTLNKSIHTLVSGATIATNAALGDKFRVTLDQSVTLSNPTNAIEGQELRWEIIQGTTGSHTISLGSLFVLGPISIVLSTTIGKKDILDAFYSEGKWYVTKFLSGY